MSWAVRSARAAYKIRPRCTSTKGAMAMALSLCSAKRPCSISTSLQEQHQRVLLQARDRAGRAQVHRAMRHAVALAVAGVASAACAFLPEHGPGVGVAFVVEQAPGPAERGRAEGLPVPRNHIPART